MKDVKEVLKLAADSMKNETLYRLLENDAEYQKRAEEARQASNVVNNLELTEDQREAVEIMIARKAEMEYDFHVNTYMAGMLDGYEILKMFNLTRE